MRIDFRHVGQFLVNIVSQHNILQPDINSGSNRQMTNNHPIGLSSVLMQDYHISQILVSAQSNQVLEHVTTSVDSLGIGHHDSHLL